MVTWDQQHLREYELRQAGAARLRAPEPERDPGPPLVAPAPGEGAGQKSPQYRFIIAFTVFRVHPLDWDNHFVKALQDMLVSHGFLPDDNWTILEGSVRCLRVSHRSEQRTEITIERIT